MSAQLRMVIVACLLFSSMGTAAAEEYRWQFSDPRAAADWAAIDASVEQGPPGSITLRGSGTFWFVSPPGLNIPPEATHLKVKLRAPETYRNWYLIVKAADNSTWQEQVELGIPGVFKVYTVDIGKGNVKRAPIDSLALAFGEIDRIELEYVKCFRPSLFELAEIRWREFWSVGYTKGTSVNFIGSPSSGRIPFMVQLYALLVFLTAGMLVMFRPVNRDSVLKSFVLSFIVVGMVFALRMDYTWYMMWRLDRASLSGKNLGERISLVDATGAYDFAGEIRTIIPPGEKVRIYGGAVATKLQYYLLPVKVSDKGRYIAVLKDSAITFDPVGRVLRRDDALIATHVSLVKAYGQDFQLYRIDGPQESPRASNLQRSMFHPPLYPCLPDRQALPSREGKINNPSFPTDGRRALPSREGKIIQTHSLLLHFVTLNSFQGLKMHGLQMLKQVQHDTFRVQHDTLFNASVLDSPFLSAKMSGKTSSPFFSVKADGEIK